MSDDDINSEIIATINENRADYLDYEKCKQIYQNLLQQQTEIKSALDINNKDSPIGATLNNAQNVITKAEQLVTTSKQTLEEVEDNLLDQENARKDVEDRLDKLYALKTSLQYMRVIQRIEFFCVELQREYKKKDDEQCVTLFANLCEISRNLTDFNGMHLRNYLKETIQYWHNILKEKFTHDFEELLKTLKWPFVSGNFSLAMPTVGYTEKLQLVAEYLLQIEIPTECVDHETRSTVLVDFTPLCLPMATLVKPLRKRFLYHFYGSRQTNRNDKPEWYFTQVLTWIRDHSDFVVKWIQPVIDKLGLHHIDARLELIKGLVQLTVEKLNSDLPSIQYDDYTFSHSVDEALGFDRELRETYDYPQSQPSILVVLTQPSVFVKWMAMEKKFATEKMDTMLADPAEAFEALASDIEDLKITTCADAFITLLQTIKERYECLPQPGHRLQFLDLQLELLDDFRVRLLQLIHADEQSIIESYTSMIANTAYYIENVLIDWGSMLHYLSLHYYKNQQIEAVNKETNAPADEVDILDFDFDTVFAGTLSLYRHMRKDLLINLAQFIVFEIKNKSKSYRYENWSTMKCEKDMRSLSLTPTACPFFEVIAKRLHQLHNKLANKLFTIVWQTVAQLLDEHLFDDLVLDNRFNEGGALQFKYDITRNLLPLFSQFSSKPDCYFTQLVESSNLLNISKGSALLLRETLIALEGATGVEDTRGKALKEVGVSYFTPKMAVKILNRRTDITVNRLVVD